MTSDDLFEAREQFIFDFYERNAVRYRKALDIGANIGVHALMMARQGWEVTAYEPDPEHYRLLQKNVVENEYVGEIVPINLAVSVADGYADFVRVLGNTTANHISGAREFHGATERIRVPTIGGAQLFEWNDFAKVDCEGHEAALLCAVRPDVPCEFIVEVGSQKNAEAIFKHFGPHRPLWGQYADSWRRVLRLVEMPTRYTEGSLFIGERP